MTYIRESLRRLVFQRANGRCEYCLLHEDDAYMPHEVDHIYAEKHGGETSEANLCLSCAECNRYKGSDLASIDPQTGEVVQLIHPRRDNWSDHFEGDGQK
jgi:5-methylcytosine-specific restriction endonuclease McrA